jgi:GTP-binding protein
MQEFERAIRRDMAFIDYAPIVFISVKTGQRIPKLIEMIKYVDNQHSIRVKTGVLNEVVSQAVMMKQPPIEKGKALKIYYATQVSTRPPTFVFFVNETDAIHFSYARYLENQFRQHFGLEGTPIRFIYRPKNKE